MGAYAALLKLSFLPHKNQYTYLVTFVQLIVILWLLHTVRFEHPKPHDDLVKLSLIFHTQFLWMEVSLALLDLILTLKTRFCNFYVLPTSHVQLLFKSQMLAYIHFIYIYLLLSFERGIICHNCHHLLKNFSLYQFIYIYFGWVGITFTCTWWGRGSISRIWLRRHILNTSFEQHYFAKKPKSIVILNHLILLYFTTHEHEKKLQLWLKLNRIHL